MSKIEIRPLSAVDVAWVQEMLQGDGWPKRSLHGWKWAIEDNPARNEIQAPMGWVMVNGAQVVGCLANIPHKIHWNGQDMMAATCTYFYVLPEWRGQAASLMRSFFLQPQVALSFSLSANVFGAPFYKFFKAKPVTQIGVNQAMVWLACPRAAAQFVVKRLKLEWVPGLALLVRSALDWYGRVGRKGVVAASAYAGRASVVPLSEIDAKFDVFWDRLKREPGLHFDCSAATLRWRMRDPDTHESLALICLISEQAVVQGYCIVMKRRETNGTAPRAQLLDWCMLCECTEEASLCLHTAAKEWAASKNLALLDARRMIGRFGTDLRKTNPWKQPLVAETHWVKATPADLTQALDEAGVWRPNLINGDEWVNLADHHERPGRQAWTSIR
jgi:hypothetical protein